MEYENVASAPVGTDAKGGGWTGHLWAHLLLIFLLAITLRLLFLDDSPWEDEFLHILAGKSWLQDGSLSLIQGGPEYTRVTLYTYLTAGVMGLLGESLAIARLPSVLFGGIWVAAIFFWTWRAVGPLAAWIAGAWFALDANAIIHSQFVRFYTLHGLAFFVAAVCVYFSWTQRGERTRSILLGLGGAGSLGLAWYLQPITAIGAMALGTWVILVASPLILEWARSVTRARRFAGLVLLATLGLLAAWVGRDVWSGAWDQFRSAPTWAQEQARNTRLYFDSFVYRYPTFWSLAPVAVIVALVRKPRAALFAVILFTVPFLLHSLAAFKAQRYLLYALPFFFILWAIVLDGFLPWLAQQLRLLSTEAWKGLTASRTPARVPGKWFGWTAMIPIILFVAYLNQGAYISFRTVFPQDSGRPYTQANWHEVGPTLKAMAAEVDLVVATSVPKAIYYLDGFDLALGRNHVEEGPDRPREFGRERLTGFPAISTVESLKEVQRCYSSGMVILDWRHGDNPFIIRPEVLEYMGRMMERLEFEESEKITLFRWTHTVRSDSMDCVNVDLQPISPGDEW